MVMEWRNGGMGEFMENGPSYSSQIELEEWQKQLAARSSCAVLGPCFVNCKKVRSFTFPGTLYMRTQEWCNRRCIYGQFKYLKNNRHTTINLWRNGGMVIEWPNGEMVIEWRNGGMVEW